MIDKSRIDSIADEMQSYYDERSSEYEQIYLRDNPPRRKEIDDEAQYIRSLCRNKNVLDLPCGTGYWTTRISQDADDIVASDCSPGMIVEAQKKEFGCPISFCRADINRLPFADRSFDIILLGFWFSHQPKQEQTKLFADLSRLVKEGGLIWMIDNNAIAEGDISAIVDYDYAGNGYKYRELSDGRKFMILKNYFSEQELNETFEPFFGIERLFFGEYYWSATLRPRP
jgi:ubiquinone/menaquinone biosynthesis C-methylase UbiE